MTTIPIKYICEVCGEAKSTACIYGLRFMPGGTNLEEREPDHANTHLCTRCMSAIKRVEINKPEPETPEAGPIFLGPPSEMDVEHLGADGNEVEAGKLYWVELRLESGVRWQAKVTTGELGVFSPWVVRGPSLRPLEKRNLESQSEDPPSETEESDKPPEPLPNCDECPLPAVLADELIWAKRKLEAQATAPRGMLNWRPLSSNVQDVEANSPRSPTGLYQVIATPGTHLRHWVARFGYADCHKGTRTECVEWCEALERDPGANPFGTAKKEDVCPKT